MSELEPIEAQLRTGEVLDRDADLIVRGWPLTIEGLLRNADATRRRYSLDGEPLAAVSAEATVEGWDVDTILSGSRLRTRRSYAAASVGAVLDRGFDLLPSFLAPHYSVVMLSYTELQAQRLLEVLGDAVPNPFFERS